MRKNQDESFFYDHPNFFVETNRMKEKNWLQKLREYCGRRFADPVQVDVAVLDQDTVKLTITPASTHKIICEDFKLTDEDGSKYLRQDTAETNDWLTKDKERQITIPFVQFIKGAVTKYPWHILNNIGGMFIVEGRDPVHLMPLIQAYKWKQRHIGNYIIVTKKVPIGTVVFTAYIDFKDKHVPYVRGASYLTFDPVKAFAPGDDL